MNKSKLAINYLDMEHPEKKKEYDF